jgi:hypothetical protein
MADVQHTNFTHATVHEPKHISIGGTGDTGKVITNSSSTAGQSEYRRLNAQSDLDGVEVVVSLREIDASVAKTLFFPAPINGVLTQITAVIDNPLVTADNIYTILVNGGATTPATMTIPFTGSAVGDVITVNISAGGGISIGQNVSLANNGGNSDATVDITFALTFER